MQSRKGVKVDIIISFTIDLPKDTLKCQTKISLDIQPITVSTTDHKKLHLNAIKK